MRRISAVAALAAMAASLVLVAGPANAQVGYPPGPCAVLTSTQSLGAFAVGTTFSLDLTPLCVFGPGETVTVSVNGQVVGVKPAGLGGSVPIEVTILSNTQLSIDDPVLVPAVCGTNTIVATGRSDVANAVVTHTATFEVVCAPSVVATPRPGFVAFTGANVLRWSAISLVLIGIGSAFVLSSRKRKVRTPEPV